MRKAIYPGSFDPLTYGHIQIIKRVKNVCNELTVLIANSPNKNYLFSAKERQLLALQCLSDLKYVKVEVFDGLITQYARDYKMDFIIRGVRGSADLEYEMTMASLNKKLAPEIETILVPADPEYSFFASRFVKEIAFYSGELKGLVPFEVEKALQLKYQNIKNLPGENQ